MYFAYFWLYPSSTASIPVERSACPWHYSQETWRSPASQALVAVKAGNPDSSSHVCVAVTWWVTKISLSLTLSPVYLSPSGKAPNTHLGLGPAKVGGLTSLPPSSAHSSASNQPGCRIPQLRVLTSRLCTSFSPPSPVLFPVLQVSASIAPPPESWQHWHEAGCPSECPCAVFCICLSPFTSFPP